MSAARLSSPMPSIDGILEGNAESQAQNSAVHEGVDASSSTPTPASLLPTAIPLHLMKTMGHRDNDIEKEEVEVFSFVLGFPDGTDPDKDAKPNTEDAQIIFEERREDKIAELQHKEEPQAPAHWFEVYSVSGYSVST
ncbi:hypothetical protein CPB84DRAFT_1842016 [Gymnopilus junonius]|uniref:Uncharacterized protein n=1 Tax=Gymnopilus junonius TaxID=109634 RepID=A0A9P5P1Z2_GYMJU|nr:hypothetical protein CPB84DRAFT_1842016 [Gymnopilus junonius]